MNGQKPAADYHQWVLLKDGGSVLIRAIRPEDKPHLLELFEDLSQESIYFRFFQYKTTLSEHELKLFTEMDFHERVGLAAVALEDGKEVFLGIGRYCRLANTQPPRAEVAFAVADRYHGRGIGSLLLDHLVPIARESGIEEFEADVLARNQRMLDVFEHSGFTVKRAVEAGVFHIELSGEGEHTLVSAHFEREQHATLESLRPLLTPASVVLVGASAREGTIGHALMNNLVQGGFAGALYPVNPKGGELLGHKVFASLEEVAAPVDLVVVATPADTVLEVARQAAALPAKAMVVISAGFAETDSAGKALQEDLVALARGSGMRLVGPNCMGILNTDPAVSLNATFAPTEPRPGNVGFLSQSGALGLAVLDYARQLNIGLSSFISAGNRADVSSNDMLTWWEADPATKVIALYLESFGNPGRFAWLAPRVGRKKPIVAVKSGRSGAGSRAAQSHSASLANLDVAIDALFEETGVIRTNSLEELFEITSLLSTQPPPKGARVGVVTNAGGPGILIADACEARGLSLPTLTDATLAGLRSFLPAAAGLSNPIDLIASATPEQFRRAAAVVGKDPNVDALVVMYIPPMVSEPQKIAQAIAAGAGEVPEDKPVLTVFISSKGAPDILSQGPRGLLPAFSFPENAANALAAAARYARWRDRDPGEASLLSPLAQSAARGVMQKALGGGDQPAWLSPPEVEAVLGAVGIQTIPSLTVAPDEAAEQAAALGFPVVMKAVGEGVVHKTELGAVLLGLNSPAEVAKGVITLRERLAAHGHQLQNVLLQPFLEGGAEFLAGITRDPTFGPLVVFGTGGIQAELFKDVAFALPPLSENAARRLIYKTKGAGQLKGWRGKPALDEAALIQTLQRLAALAYAVPELIEADLNPVTVLPDGKGAIVLDARIRTGPADWRWGLPPFNK